jgi:hypothetical protein
MPRRAILPLALAVLAAGCSSPEDVAEKTGVEAAGKSATVFARASATASGLARSDEESTDLYEFSYAWPGAVGAQPELAVHLQADLDLQKRGLVKQASEAQADAKANDFPFNPHSFSEEWKVVAELPGWLSLSGEFSTYSGGAHGMYGLESLVWDKRARKALDGIDLFDSPEALDEALGRKLCEALDAERAERRGEAVPQVPEGEDYGFNSCQQVGDSTVLVGSSSGDTFDRIAIWFGPYVAGPYAEGAYELDFPVDKAVLAAVKPEYRSVFAVRR